MKQVYPLKLLKLLFLPLPYLSRLRQPRPWKFLARSWTTHIYTSRQFWDATPHKAVHEFCWFTSLCEGKSEYYNLLQFFFVHRFISFLDLSIWLFWIFTKIRIFFRPTNRSNGKLKSYVHKTKYNNTRNRWNKKKTSIFVSIEVLAVLWFFRLRWMGGGWWMDVFCLLDFFHLY